MKKTLSIIVCLMILASFGCGKELTYDDYIDEALNKHIKSEKLNSINPSLVLDDDGYPHIVWEEQAFRKSTLVYTRWDGENWVIADGLIYDPENMECFVNRDISPTSRSRFPDIELDSNGYPNLAWFSDSNSVLAYIKWNGEKWITATGEEYSTDNGWETNAELIPRGDDLFRGQNNSIIDLWLDDKDLPNVFAGNTNGSGADNCGRCISYAYWDGRKCRNIEGEEVETYYRSDILRELVYDDFKQPSFALGSDGVKHFLLSDFYDEKHSDLFYLSNEGEGFKTIYGKEFVPENRDYFIGRTDGISTRPKLVLDKDNHPVILWHEQIGEKISLYFVRWDGEKLVCADGKIFNPKSENAKLDLPIDVSMWSDLTLDSNGNPHIVYTQDNIDGSNILYYATWEKGKFSSDNLIIENINEVFSDTIDAASVTQKPLIKLDKQNNPVVVGSKSKSGRMVIFCVRFDGERWENLK